MSRDEQFSELPEDTMLLVNRLCNRYEQTWQAGERPRLEAFLTEVDASRRRAALYELIPLEIEYRRLAGDAIDVAEYQRRFPECDAAWLAATCQVEPESPAQRKPASETRAEPGNAATARTTNAPRKTQRLGDYELLAKLGGGGMGTVYKAMHRRMHRVVALKVLRADLKNRPELRARFEREVRTAARLTHPNIVAALDAREDKGFQYLITEFVDGIDLDRLVKSEGPRSVAQAADFILQAARGLAFAHQRQVIHRDIKPANLLVDREGVVKILDMGLARLADEEDWSSSQNPTLTASGMIMGTAAYMAPEQARQTKTADERSDIYALGCTLYYLLTGRPPYPAASAVDMILAHVTDPIPELEASAAGEPVPVALRDIFRRMVAKNPADRFQHMLDIIAALEPLVPGAATSITAGTTTVADRPTVTIAAQPAARNKVGHSPARTRTRNGKRLGAGLACCLAGAIGLVIWATSGEGERPGQNNGGNVPLPAIGSAPPATVPSPGPRFTGQNRFGLAFDGQNGYVAVPSLTLPRGVPVTLEAIVQVRARRVSNVISWLGPDWIALFQSGDGTWGLGRRLGSESRLRVTTEPAALEQWIHLAATVDGENLILFVNGQPGSLRSLEFAMPETQGGLYIGGVRADLLPADQNDRFFDGIVDAVRVSRGIRYQEPFAPPGSMSPDAATLALFQLDEGQGHRAEDSSGQGHHGQIVNAPWIRLN